MKKGKLRKYSAWAKEGDNSPNTIHEGTERPCTLNGTPLPDCDELIWVIEACNWEEAMAIYHLRQGWEPYSPNSKPSRCPKCGECFYPTGSGKCWYCDHKA